jgi:hypothetical protein
VAQVKRAIEENHTPREESMRYCWKLCFILLLLYAAGAGAAREKGLKPNKWHERAIHKIVGMPNNEVWIEENHMAWLQLKTKRLDKAKIKLKWRMSKGRRTGTRYRRKILRINREYRHEMKQNKGEDDFVFYWYDAHPTTTG